MIVANSEAEYPVLEFHAVYEGEEVRSIEVEQFDIYIYIILNYNT